MSVNWNDRQKAFPNICSGNKYKGITINILPKKTQPKPNALLSTALRTYSFQFISTNVKSFFGRYVFLSECFHLK